MIKILDYFHVVWRIREPEEYKLSRVMHMVSSLVDIQETPAIARPTFITTAHILIIIPGSGQHCGEGGG